MKRWFLAGLAAVGAGAVAQAQPATPGYMIIRVVLDAPPGQPARPLASVGVSPIELHLPSAPGYGGVGVRRAWTPPLLPDEQLLQDDPQGEDGPGVAGAQQSLGATKARSTLPFTGAQLWLFALVGIALIAGGALLKTTARQKSRS